MTNDLPENKKKDEDLYVVLTIPVYLNDLKIYIFVCIFFVSSSENKSKNQQKQNSLFFIFKRMNRIRH